MITPDASVTSVTSAAPAVPAIARVLVPIQLRGGATARGRNDGAVRPWHALSGRGTMPVDVLAGLLPRL